MTGDRPLVLVAEDEPIASMALRAQLDALGYRVLGPARNGDDALALGTCFPVDLALLDIRMPGRTGLEVAAELFEAAPTPVLLLTGFSGADLPDPMPKPPVFGVLTKPIGLTELRDGIVKAEAGFREWRDMDPEHAAAVAESRREREVIQQAVDQQEEPAAAAAVSIISAAREEGRSPADVAADLLAR